jgi:hypothetical protein
MGFASLQEKPDDSVHITRKAAARPSRKTRQSTPSCPRRRPPSSFSHRSGYRLLTVVHLPTLCVPLATRQRYLRPTSGWPGPRRERSLAGRLQCRAVTVVQHRLLGSTARCTNCSGSHIFVRFPAFWDTQHTPPGRNTETDGSSTAEGFVDHSHTCEVLNGHSCGSA